MKSETPATTAKRPRQCITPRQRRLIEALLRGPVTRRAADDAIGTTNAPQYVSELRRLGLSITTKYVHSTDRDGVRTRTGIYHLEPESWKLADMLASKGVPETTPRQRRLIEALLRGPVTRRAADIAIRNKIGKTAPQCVYGLRRLGLSITTRYVHSTDRDGVRTRTGIYHLEPESRELADSLTSKDAPGTSGE